MAKAPKLKIFAIFGIIVMDIGLTYGPLFPAPPYTIPTIFMLPIGVALGVAFACMLLIFPETLSHSWTTGLTELLGTLSKLLSVHQDSLKAIAQHPAAARSFETKFAPVRLGAIDLLESLGGQQAFLDLEVSYARYSNKDLKSMYKKVALTTVRLMGIQAFHHFIEDDDINYGVSLDDVTEGQEVLNDDVEKQTVHAADTARLHDLRQKMRVAQRQQGVELSQLLPKMEAASERLFAASYQCLHETSEWLRSTNQNRWLGQQSAEQHQKSLDLLNAAAEELTEAVADFKSKELAQLIAPYAQHFRIGDDGEHFLTDETVQDFSLGCRPLHLAFVWVKNQERFALTLADFTREVHHIAEKHPRSKLWFPLSLRKLWKVAFSRHHGHTGGIVSAGAQGVEEPAPATSSSSSSTTSVNHGADDSDEEEEEALPDKRELKRQEKAKAAERKAEAKRKRLQAIRDLDSLPPSHVGHTLGRSLAGFYDFFSSSDGMFALRFVIGSIALWVPAVLPSSAGFVYQNRGIWALIMFQTGMASTSGELFFSIAARLLGTVIGLLAGAVCWYIGSGSGNGNPYGLAATMAVVLLPIMFFRLYAPPILLLPTMMCGVTVVLIVGYSWIDAGHLAGISVNSGIGIEVAWRRGLLVIIGMAVSVIIVLFPRPPSTRKQVRLHFAASTASILDLYESLMGAFVTVADGQEDLASLDETLASLRPRYVGALMTGSGGDASGRGHPSAAHRSLKT
ncbi:Predicted membrane protein [Ceraceosorus bombacis]|uniref:Predicted membrane protein n=1 Tax=Ceraceosorus bombacis TaxID=401625 RepID=A0A0P1BI48_9BASI|nr:Predicted membrane protein [Ceraceosorus bombacis]